ncbi:hypothetical protein [Paenibacillus massiliensis]|uniref:hypothetical protein n=1 Tax=Paenibacillus massiliensis TaxID=225917 RepID=UPI000374DF39|nr:hypothetical protein [Paenibacillus massiliensis]
MMSVNREAVNQDYIIEHVCELFRCRVLWSEGRPCLEYESEEELGEIVLYVKENFATELLDVFFTAIPSLPVED